MACAKGPGKTAVLAWLSWIFLLTRAHSQIKACSISAQNLKDNLWKELAHWRSRSPILQQSFDFNAERITSKVDPEIWWMAAASWAKTASADELGLTLAGLHAVKSMAIIDEAGGVPIQIKNAAEAIFASNYGNPDKEAHLLIAGNTTSRTGALYQAAIKEAHLYQVYRITSDPDDPKRSPRTSPEYAKQQIETYGRDHPFVKVNIFAEFPDQEFNALISETDVLNAMQRDIPDALFQSDPRILSVDVARFGADSSVITPRHGPKMYKQYQFRNLDNVQGAGHVARLWQDWEADAVFIDNGGGYGAGWGDILKSMRFRPIMVDGSSTDCDPQYYNKRTECVAKLCQWIRDGGCLPNDPELLQELVVPQYGFKGDRLLLEPTESIKVSLGRSPDKLMSASYGFAEPVRSQPMRDQLYHKQRQRYAET